VPGDWGYGWRSLLTAMTAIEPQERPTALEVSARGQDLDVGVAGPATTGLVSPNETDSHTAARPAGDRTKVLASPPPIPPLPQSVSSTAPTALLGGAGMSAPSTGAAPRAADRPSHRRRWAILLAAAGVVLVALVVSVMLWNGLADAPPPTPELPQLEEPLGTHLRELLEEVSP
jgi:hypothetical protein